MTKMELISEILRQGIVDEALELLFEASMTEKRLLKNENRNCRARLNAINKIANSTRDIEAIKALSERSEDDE